MSGKLTIIANAGRSGSTFLYRHFQKALSGDIYVAHEDIPVQISKPRQYNRAYASQDLDSILNDTALVTHINKWEQKCSASDVIETGWTCYHLLPLLWQVFGSRMKVIVLHRDPWSVALSRASMGNYHPDTWYDDAHEVSPFDLRSISPHYAKIWNEMNHAEKCLFWWYVIYQEITEFLDKTPEVPHIFVSSNDIFRGDGMTRIGQFIGHDLFASPVDDQVVGRNSVQPFMAETFPILDEHKSFSKHQEISEFAKQKFGYQFSSDRIDLIAKNYKLSSGLMPYIRHTTNFWTWRKRIGNLLRSSRS